MRFLACALLVIAATCATDAKSIVNAEETCVPNSQYYHYCNDCFCGPDGLVATSFCTALLCAHDIENQYTTEKIAPAATTAQPEESPKTCQPDKSFAYYCNDCVCRADGLVKNAQCTRMSCDPKEWNEDGTRKNFPTSTTEATRVDNRERCTPGGSFPYYCNTCSCGDDGIAENAVCTWMQCDDDWNRDGTLKVIEGEASKDEDRCYPGQIFANYCATCVCGEDGLVENALCPFMLCDRENYFRNGTRKPLEVVSNDSGNLGRCTPGGSFSYYCNTCACGDDGNVESAACTWIHCDDSWNRDGTLKISQGQSTKDEEKCPAGSYFANYCINCLCGSDGLAKYALCPFTPCDQDAYYKNGTRKSVDEVNGNDNSKDKDGTRKPVDEVASEDRCVPGKSFPYYCNTCSCGEDGIADNALCTWMRCGDDWNKDGTMREICEPGERFKDYCNDCICGSDGFVDNARCTKEFCNPNVWNKDGTRKVPPKVTVAPPVEPEKPNDTCVIGTTFKYYCDDCYCLDGSRSNALCMYGCIRSHYNEDGTKKNFKPEELCEPATYFKDYCNRCFCGPDGLKANADCTKMFCDRDEWNQDGTKKNAKPEETCVPGSNFKYYCNECYCKDDGLKASADCTRMLCDRNEFNEDGTRKYPESDYSNWDNDYVDDPDKPFSLNPVSFGRRN